MDVATRKRVISSNLDGPAAKVQAALQAPEPPNGFADVLFVNLLNALNMTESSGRLSLIEDMIFRLKWLKKYYDQNESPPNTSTKSPIGSPRQPEPHKPLDHLNMRRFIDKEKDSLQNLSKLIGVAAQGPPLLPGPPPMQPPRIIPPTPEPPKPEAAKKSPVPINTIAAALAPPPPAPGPVALTPVAPAPIAVPPPSLTPKIKKPAAEKKVLSPPPPPQMQFPFNPAKAEEMILDLQEKQRKLLNYISAAHGGKVTDEVLHDYLRHPYVLLKENGQTRKQPNPFYHLMAQNGQGMRMMPPIPPAVIMKPPESSKPATPIPAPPILLPQVDLPMKKDIKMEVSPPPDKCSPPPHLPLQVPLLPAQFDPAKPFVMPVTRECNQWSVVSMALPLRLLCRCFQTPCRCSQ